MRIEPRSLLVAKALLALLLNCWSFLEGMHAVLNGALVCLSR